MLIWRRITETPCARCARGVKKPLMGSAKENGITLGEEKSVNAPAAAEVNRLPSLGQREMGGSSCASICGSGTMRAQGGRQRSCSRKATAIALRQSPCAVWPSNRLSPYEGCNGLERKECKILVNLKDICAIAEQKHMATSAFNASSLETVRAAIATAEDLHLPVITDHAEGHEAFTPLKDIGPVMGSVSGAFKCYDLRTLGLLPTSLLHEACSRYGLNRYDVSWLYVSVRGEHRTRPAHR